MIYETTYKGRPAYQVKAARLTAVFLQEDGGKMASLQYGDRELLAQAKETHYRRLLPDGDYVSSECSAFDDMFPTIDPYTPDQGLFAGTTYPDHGEVCRYPHQVQVAADGLTFSFSSRRFPVDFAKHIHVNPEGNLVMDYTLTNNGPEPFPYIWAAHCMIQAEPDATIVCPYGSAAPVKSMFGKLLSRDSMQPFTEDGESYKFYYEEPIPEGWCGYRYSDGKTLMLRYPAEIVKFLGIWINNGSFKGMYNIALEPCTAPYDRPDQADAAGCGSVLQPGETVCFRLTMDME